MAVHGFSICPRPPIYVRFAKFELYKDGNILLNLAFDNYRRSETNFQFDLDCKIVNFSSNIVLYTVGMFLSAIPYTVYSPYKVSDQRDGLFREGITPAVLYIIHSYSSCA